MSPPNEPGIGVDAARRMGLAPFELTGGLTDGERAVREKA